MVKESSPTAWHPDMEFDDEAHYHRVVKAFSKELLAMHTPEELAEVAASNIIFVSVLEARNKTHETLSKTQEATSKALQKTLALQEQASTHRITYLEEQNAQKETALANAAKGITSVAMIACEATKKAISKKAANARHRPVNEQKERLMEEWDRDGHSYKSRADFSRIVSRRENIKDRTLYEWIATHDKNKNV